MTRESFLLPMWAARSTLAGAIFMLAFGAAPLASAQDDGGQDEAAVEEGAAADPAPASEESVPPEGANERPTANQQAEQVPTVPVDTAAEAAPKDGTRLDTIEVTGSRLRRTDYETAQPVLTISREDIERTGLTDISQLLRQIPAAGNASVNTQAQARTTSLGETSLDLRNLGAVRTLLLVNGRRWVTGLVSTQPSQVDLNTIPTQIIERIEVLKDGASAIYGSDAIGGVVNVITRKDYSGWGLTSQIGQYVAEGDGTKHQHALSWGHVTSDTSIFANVSFTEEQEAYAKNRKITESPFPETGFSRWGNALPSGRFLFIPTESNAAFYQCPNLQGGIAQGVAGGGEFGNTVGGAAGQTGAIPAGVVLCDLTLIQGEPGGSPEMYRQRDPTNIQDRYNHYREAVLQQPSQRTAFFTTVSHQIAERINMNFEALYNVRRSTGVYGALTIFGGNLIGVDAPAPATNPNNPFGQDIGIDSSCGVDPNSPTCTGLGVGSGAWIMRLPNEERAIWHFDNAADTLRLGWGLNGDFDWLNTGWFWDAGYITANAKNVEMTPLVRFDKLKPAMESDDCGEGCVPFNPFRGQAGVTPEMLDYIYQDTVQRNKSKQDIVYAGVSTNFDVLQQYLAGPLAMAMGLEYRRDEYSSVPDPVVQAGLTFLNQQAPTAGTTNAKEAFIEFGIPVLKDRVGAENLDLSLAGRYSQYPGFGSVTTYKSGVRWNPLSDLLVRATYSTGFRAPNIGELYLGPAQSFDPMTDPCTGPETDNETANCEEDGVNPDVAASTETSTYSIWSGNPDLKPEESTNLTYGVVYSPYFLPDLNLYVDAYKISVDDYISIGGPLAQFYIDSCYDVPPDQRTYCEKIHRKPSGALDYVDTPFVNFSKLDTEGVDFGFDYLLPVPADFGSFKVALDASYLTKYTITRPRPGQADDVTNWVGKSDLLTGWPRWKAGMNLAWKRDQLSAAWITRMAYKMTEPCSDGYPGQPSFGELGLCTFNSPAVADDLTTPDVDESKPDESMNTWKTTFYHNAQVGYGLPQWNADITVGVHNVFDTDPVKSFGLSGVYWYNYDPQHYDTPGRFPYVRLDMRF